MSHSSEKKINNIKKKNSTLFYGDLIQYSEMSSTDDFLETMKNGYIEMGEINLKLAMESEEDLIDVNKYETWLYGV